MLSRRGRSLLCVLLAALLPSAAAASDTHYQEMLLGTRAFGLGGAYAALANDPSGLFYNPGGMVGARRSNIQVSSTFFVVDDLRLDTEAMELSDSRDLESFGLDDLTIVGAIVGGIFGLGERRPDKTWNHALAVALMLPEFENLSQRRELVGAATTRRFERELQEGELWLSVGYSARVAEGVGLGLSAIYMHRYFDRTDRTLLRSTPYPADAPSTGFLEADTLYSVSTGNLVFVGGVHFTLPEGFQLGVAVGSPGIPISHDGSLRYAERSTIGGHKEENYETDSGGVRVPFFVRVGGAWVWTRRMTVTADVTVHGPVDYDLLDAPGAAARAPVPTSITREAVANVNVGVEYLFVEKLSLAVGFYTDLSSAPAIPESPTHDMLPRIDVFGGTMALGYFLEHSLLRIGLGYSRGVGYDVVRTDYGGYERAESRRQSFSIFVGSTFRY